jgi:hypothetical protein
MVNNSKASDNKNNVLDLIFKGVLTILKRKNTWVGTMTQLNDSLVRVLGKRASTSLPKSPSALRVSLNKTLNRLRNRSISVKFGRTNSARYVKFVTR